MSGVLIIDNGVLAARIDPLGAELVSLRDTNGCEYLTDADPAFWSGHAPVLFPIVGRLNGDVLRIDGREYPMRQHGFARRMVWEPVQLQAEEARLRLRDNDATRACYPFAFELEMHFRLAGATLSMQAHVRNPGTVQLPFSLGFHPAFAWPLPGGGEKAGHFIRFAKSEPQDICRLDGNGLLAGKEHSPLTGDTLRLSSALFEADALIWDRLASRRLEYRSPDGPWLEVEFDLPMLGIWQKPGASFICIEPWAGHADPAGFGGAFAAKPGLEILPPGGERSFAMQVTVHQG